jgi:hypothetical protein
MPTVAGPINSPFAECGSLLDALDALRNVRAFVTLALTFVAFAIAVLVLGAVSTWISTKSGAIGVISFGLSALIWAGIMVVGTTAVGILLSDDVWGRDRRTIASALTASSLTAHRLVVLMLLASAGFLSYLVVVALALFVCKIPGLGPLLYAIVFPVAALATGLLVFSLFYVMLPLAAPCIWNGDSITKVIATLKEVIRCRRLYVFAMFLLLGLMVLVTAGIVGFIIFSGTGLTVSLSLAIVGVGGGLDLSSMMMGHGDMAAGAGGYGIAFGLGMTLLMLIGSIPASLIGMKGAAIIHKGAIVGLAVDEAEAEFQYQVDEVKRRAQETRDKALAPKPVPAPKPLVCPNAHCGAPVSVDDAFCIECGEKLK